MRRRVVGIVIGIVMVIACGAGGGALAHHSMAMFDQLHPIELEGVVQDFRFVSPHVFILLEVKASDGAANIWSLEGDSPSHLARDGWGSKSLKSGDEVKVKIWPLRSGAPGGYWSSEKISYRNGKPIVEQSAN